MESYSPFFKKAHELSKEVDYSKTFEDFHNHPELFHFIMAPPSQYHTDEGAIKDAYDLHPQIAQMLLDKGPSLLGRGSEVLDGVESRHILITTALITALGPHLGRVIEIGGGYGNTLRLIDGIVTYDRWSIIDLDYICDLQYWFLKKSGLNLEKAEFISSDALAEQITLIPDVVLGVHSLSEFDMDTFLQYLPIINKATWFIYVSQVSNPSVELLTEKFRLLETTFNVVSIIIYEGGNSIIHLLKNKEAL
jgi:hypothetical protein